MRHLARRHLIFIALTSCATAPGPTNNVTHTKHPIFVASSGSDSAPGTEAMPLRTIEHALEIEDGSPILVGQGTYADSGLKIVRSVEIVGPAGGVSIAGKISIASSDVSLRSLDLSHGVAADGVRGVVLDTLHVKSGGEADAIALNQSSAQIHDVDVACGLETCLQITSSTVSMALVRLAPDPGTKRGIRIETSSATLSAIDGSGTQIAVVQIGRASNVRISDSHLIDGQGTALSAIDAASLTADRVTLSAANFAALVQTSHVSIRGSSVVAPKGIAIGIAGGDVALSEVAIEISAQGAISVSAHDGKNAKLKISGGSIHHAAFSGVLLTQGDLTVRGTRFTGDPNAESDGGDAITANGQDATLNVQATFDSPAGFGVSLQGNASGTITATITHPRLGGISIDGVAGAPITVRGGHIEGCRSGSGIAVLDATDVTISGTSITGCPDAGVLGGQGATMSVSNGSLLNNAQYGIAAFGGSVIEVSGSRVKGSRWALFASCGDRARIEDGGGNRIEGPTALCP